MDDETKYIPLRERDFPCRFCGNVTGVITPKGAQDCVFCAKCRKWLYNAPRTETGHEVRPVTKREAFKPGLRYDILERDGFRCCLCGQACEKAELHVDHIIPVSMRDELCMTADEANSPDNLMTLCAACNLGKKDKLLPLPVLLAILRKRIQSK